MNSEVVTKYRPSAIQQSSARRRSWRKLSGLLGQVLIHAALIVLAFSMLAPFLWMISTSLKVRGEVFTVPLEWIPRSLHFENYPNALSAAPFPRFFLNSLIIGVSIVLGRLVFCSMGAYAFARLRWPGRDTVFLAYLSTMMIPGQVTLIPSFLIIHWLGWMNTYYALIVPGFASAFGTFLLRQFFLTIPGELEDAARIDGCNRLLILRHVILPLSKQALAVLSLFTFMEAWNEFLWPLLVTNSDSMRTVQVGLSVFKDQFYIIQWPELMAGTTVVTLPVLIVYLLAQNYLIEGIAMSGLKG
ncbi:MAG: carbohydrate ABC transporter permease [Chloroflexi bacterium]|nr:carbohydrate ABC transporter permease [Chloroflexota bacterium]